MDCFPNMGKKYCAQGANSLGANLKLVLHWI